MISNVVVNAYFIHKLSRLRLCEPNFAFGLPDLTRFFVTGVVKKRRFLYMVGQTRVHVDHVDNLGDFMELEVMPFLGAGDNGIKCRIIGELVSTKVLDFIFRYLVSMSFQNFTIYFQNFIDIFDH